MYQIILSLLILVGAFYIINKSLFRKWRKPQRLISDRWRKILEEKVNYYTTLNTKDKKSFEFRVQEFILNYKIIGIDVEVDDTDRILVAASAIIPVFAFPNWRYTNLEIVQLYPAMFNEDFETTGAGRRTLGMVGTGFMEGKMILSKPALHHGFSNETDKKNTAIHEFVHLIDKSDNATDGIPKVLLDKQYTIPWLDLIAQKIDAIYKEKSDINPYGGTSKTEFFAVASEYFFERPKLMARKHPELYKILEEMFNQDMRKRV